MSSMYETGRESENLNRLTINDDGKGNDQELFEKEVDEIVNHVGAILNDDEGLVR